MARFADGSSWLQTEAAGCSRLGYRRLVVVGLSSDVFTSSSKPLTGLQRLVLGVLDPPPEPLDQSEHVLVALSKRQPISARLRCDVMMAGGWSQETVSVS